MTNSARKPLVIFLMGPTASGKTDLAISLSKLLPVELISVDSALVYRGMDIGSAKPTAAELAETPHRLIDIRDPAEPYSVADFVADAEREIQAIHAQGRVPLLVGGTMLYYRALTHGLAPLPAADAINQMNELWTRLVLRTPDKAAADGFGRLCPWMGLSGPAYTCGFTGLHNTSELLGIWPTLMPRAEVEQGVRVELLS